MFCRNTKRAPLDLQGIRFMKMTKRHGHYSPPFKIAAHMAVLFAVVLLSGCDQLGIDTPQKERERAEADAKAIGSACRHAMRAIEDCYVLNPKAEKSAVFAGWREMDEYMRENKLDGVAPVVPRPAPAASAPAKASDAEDDDTEDSTPEDKSASSKSKADSKKSAH